MILLITIFTCVFVSSESRRILLPVVLHHIHLHLRQQKELLICSGILSSIFSIIKASSLVTHRHTHTCSIYMVQVSGYRKTCKIKKKDTMIPDLSL